MALDPTNPGAMRLNTMSLTKAQVRTLGQFVSDHLADDKRLDSVRLEELRDAYVRAVLIGPDGDPVDERTLFPV